jgi:outer membrane biosynthesis protein TonB
MRTALLALTPLLLAASPPLPKKTVIDVDAYPESATLIGAEGDVGLDLAIDARGQVAGCTITAGADLPGGLAAETCRIVRKDWRFAPALDDAGKKSAGRMQFTIAWRILQRCPPATATTICVFL